MSSLPLWRQCRILAHPLRLEMLDLLSQRSPLCVKEIAEALQIGDEVAGKNLQLMAAAGFLTQRSAGKYLYYTAAHKNGLINGILGHDLTREQVIYTVTALTHERRISIIQALASEPLEFAVVCRKPGISLRAMQRHVEKLERRGLLSVVNGRWSRSTPGSVLGRRLVELALKDGTPAQVCRTLDRRHQ